MVEDYQVKDAKLYNIFKSIMKIILNDYSDLADNHIPKINKKSYQTIVFPSIEDRIFPYTVLEHEYEYKDYTFTVEDIMYRLVKNGIHTSIMDHIKRNYNIEGVNHISLENFLFVYFDNNQKFELNKNLLKNIYKSFEDCLNGAIVTTKALTIITNVNINKDEILLDKNTKLIQISESLHDVIYNETMEKNYLEQLLKRKGGVILEQIVETNAKTRETFYSSKKRNELINLIALFTDGDFATINTIIFPGNHFVKKFLILDENKIPLGNINKDYVINSSVEFIEFYILYISLYTKFSSFVNLAISRFNQTRYRKKIEDRLVDIIIAFETIFLNNNPELSFRLCYNVAYFIGLNASERREIFDTIKSAYKIRSKIIHGSGKAKITGEEMRNLVDILREYFRRSIRIMLEKKYTSYSKDKFLKLTENKSLGIVCEK